MNERIERLAEQAGMIVDKYGLARDAENGLEDGVDIYKFAELLLKDAFTIIKEAMVGEDMTVVEEIIADRLDDAAGDVCDQLGLMGPIYEG